NYCFTPAPGCCVIGSWTPIRTMAANALLDRGWGKAAQLVGVDGEIRQLVEVKLNVVRSPDLSNEQVCIDTKSLKSLENVARPQTNSTQLVSEPSADGDAPAK